MLSPSLINLLEMETITLMIGIQVCQSRLFIFDIMTNFFSVDAAGVTSVPLPSHSDSTELEQSDPAPQDGALGVNQTLSNAGFSFHPL